MIEPYPEYLCQIANELDDTAVNPPCSEAEILRGAAAELKRLEEKNMIQIDENRWVRASGVISVEACMWYPVGPAVAVILQNERPLVIHQPNYEAAQAYAAELVEKINEANAP